MVDRILMGNTGSGYDLLVSKPGVDVKTALPGQLLLGKGTSILQVLAQGYQQLNSPPTAYARATYSIPMPAELAGYTDLFVWIKISATLNGSPYNGEEYQAGGYDDAAARLINGVLYIYSNMNSNFGTAFYTPYGLYVYDPGILYCRWAVFRMRYV